MLAKGHCKGDVSFTLNKILEHLRGGNSHGLAATCWRLGGGEVYQKLKSDISGFLKKR